MHTLKSTISSKGQVTIPQDVRALMGLEPGDAVVFACDKGHVEIQKAVSDYNVWSIAGSLDGKGKKGVSMTIEEMNTSIAEGISKKLIQ